MLKKITIENLIERRSYLKGKFNGKFIGYLDFKKSDFNHDNYYDIEILSGSISGNRGDLHHWKNGEPLDYKSVDEFLTKLPDTLPLTLYYEDGTEKHFNVNLNEPKLSNYKLSFQQYEGNKVWGTIDGEISGFLKHYDKEIDVVTITEEKDLVIEPKILKKVKTNKQTGKTEIKENYIRWEYYYSDGSTYWGEWKYQGSYNGFSFWNGLLSLLLLFYFLAIIIPIIVAGWRILLPIIAIIGIFYLLPLVLPLISIIGKWLIKLAAILFILFLLYGIYTFNTSPIIENVEMKVTNDDLNEITEIKPNPDFIGDSIISHYRIWQDYEKNTYKSYVRVNLSDFKNSNSFRKNIRYKLTSSEEYNLIVSSIHNFDKSKLQFLYSLFDSLKVEHSLNNLQFAEMIGTFIQDIPYTLILDDNCSPHLYNDDFIIKYLEQGGKCEGLIKYGLLSPIEFMGTLLGDCDTRTLLLFTVFNHYGFDVAMLGSELYRHSVIGINLPYNGTYKSINGKRYVIWETTNKGLYPGLFPREISDMRFWNVNLISKN